MASSFALIALFSLALFASITEARKDLGAYWQGVPRDQHLQEAIQRLLDVDSSVSEKKSTDCNTSNDKKKTFVKDFKPQPHFWASYGDDVKLEEEKTFTKGFEPRPHLWAGIGDD